MQAGSLYSKWVHSRAIQAAYTSNLTKVGNGRQVRVCVRAENIENTWLPIQTYGEASKGCNFNSKA